MGNWKQSIILSIIFTTCFHFSYGCQMDGTNWPLPVSATIKDTFRGVVIDRGTTDIQGINSISYGEALNSGPYVDISFADARFVITTNDAFENYEENETTQLMPITVTFSCTGGSNMILTFMITVEDTNNNAPRFIPSNEFVYTISPPIPPGFEVTGCFNDLTVRDIDLTTQRIDFAVIDNPYFEIEYDAASSTTPKEFKAILKTTTLIRTIPEPITLIITATDVDLTGDPPLTTTATVTIIGNTEFELPDEPVFAEAFYLAEYTDDNQLFLTEPISLRSGYHELVNFTLEGDFSNNFELDRNGNQVSIRVVTPLPVNDISEKHVFLIVRANREHTSGDSTTVVVQLPEDVPLEFERAHYEGTIENNNLQVPQLILRQGYEEASVSAVVLNEHSSYFTAIVEGNTITLSMTPLNESIVNENSFINLQIVASTSRSTATTIVIIEIIKDDNVTPVFNRPIYTGSFNPDIGLTIEQIELVQGYDGDVTMSLNGDNADYFEVIRDGPVVTLNASNIPLEIFSDRRILLSLEANKPRTVGANAAIYITLPEEAIDSIILHFAQNNYIGVIENGQLQLPTITLLGDITEDISLNIIGDHAQYFAVSQNGTNITIQLSTDLPTTVITEHAFIVLEVSASYTGAVNAYTTVVIEIIKEETVTPVFDKAYYAGVYSEQDGLLLENTIRLIQGFDESISFTLDGDDSHWFTIVQNVENITLSVTSNGIPIEDKSHLVFSIVANKSGSLTVSAAIVITLADFSTSRYLQFSRDYYMGSIDGSSLTLNAISLEGYSNAVVYALTGDYADYFQLMNQNGVFTLQLLSELPPEITAGNDFLIFTLEAQTQNTRIHTTIILEIVKYPGTDIDLDFNEIFYIGSYSEEGGLSFDTEIRLSEEFNTTISYSLEGSQAQWFDLIQTGNAISLNLTTPIPNIVLQNNQQLVFAIRADGSGWNTATATIIVTILKGDTNYIILGFDQVTYSGTIVNNVTNIGPITLIEEFSDDVTFSLNGDLSSYFGVSRQGLFVDITLQTPIPPLLIPANRIIVLGIQASSPQALTAHATVLFEVLVENDASSAVQLIFNAPYYTGVYNANDGLVVETPISLSEGYDDSVQFALEGDNAQWFSLVREQNSVTLILTSAIPGAVLTNYRQLVFVITAQRPESTIARATIVISLADDNTNISNLGFDRVTYLGTIQNNLTNIGPITIIEGYTDDITLSLYGELSSHFGLTRQRHVVNITIQTPIPVLVIPANRIIVLEIRASAQFSGTAHATIVFEVDMENDDSSAVQLIFDAPFYTGSYNANDGLIVESPISLSEGYDDSVQFNLEGENAQWFSVVREQNSLTLTLTSAIPGAVLTNYRQLVFVITAQRLGSATTRAPIIISLTDEITEVSIIGFDRVTYLGAIHNNVTDIEPITLIEGYTDDVTLSLYGELSTYFGLARQESVVNITIQTPIPALLIPANRIIVLEIRASAQQFGTAHATIVFEVVVENDDSWAVQLVFDAPFYTGSYNANDGLIVESTISLSEGYDDTVQFALEGEYAHWFSLVRERNSVTLILTSAIPGAVLTNNRQLVFVITAQRPESITARASIIIFLTDTFQIEDDVSFEKVLYEGIIQLDEVQHEAILLSGYNGINLNVFGEYSSLFMAYVTDGVVSVQASGSVILPADVTRLALELHAAGARAVLLLNVIQADVPVSPAVTFTSESYVLNVEIVQTGFVGRVAATADNGETVTYSLATDNAHLQTRLSINNDGELYLSAPANSGVYSFQVIATTVITQATGAATIYLTVEAVTVCEVNDIVMPPLIILDRDEEEPHYNLVVLNSTQYEGCHFSLTNRWPADQTWLHVDEYGLHATAIDREHDSIAFMALSQVQVELILHCESDNVIRTKRSERTDWLGPYDYGTSKWILTDTIAFNSRRSLVNLIVNDINDNAPIFVGKKHEPIAVGYPIEELVERILPRSLAELKATDADIGENAALRYWSSESELAVAPSTGFVHLRNGARLQNNQTLAVSATDRLGEGLTGSLQLVVKLLNLNNIAVVTVRDAFLDDEMNILTQLSNAVGYEVKTLRSIVISDDIDEDVIRKKRETNTAGTSLRLYVYGLIEREPIVVDRLTEDIKNNAAIVNVISTLSLEDHLEDSQINILQRDVGLLIATIVLSILLFILILLIAIWFFLRWRKNRTYDEFSDENSLASRNGSLGEQPKPEGLKPRLNIEDLKKSERRLQDMLNNPVEEITVEPMTTKKETPLESIFDLPLPEPNAPIVIQSIDKLKDADGSDDEFGESKDTRRKSVVTFNENVEKIIHVEDDTDSSSQSGYEIYKL